MKRSGDPLYAREINSLLSALSRPFSAGNGVAFSAGPGGVHVGARARAGRFVNEPATAATGLNIGSGDLPVYAPCEVSGSVYSSTQAERRRALQVRVPTAAAKGKFAVCGVPIAAGRAGRIYLGGVCLCRVQTHSGDQYADSSAGNDFLAGSPSDGSAQILWEDGGPSLTTHLALIRFPRGGSGGNGTARAVSDIPLTLSNTQTVDGVALGDGDLALVAGQSSSVDNGIYTVKSGAAWVRSGNLIAGLAVTITEGAEYANTVWILDQQSPITPGVTGLPFRISNPPLLRHARVATTAAITLSGLQTIDGISLSPGDYVLVKAQSSSAANGLYRVSSSAWLLAPAQPRAVLVSEGTAGGRMTYFGVSNVWSPNYGVLGP